MISKSIIVKQGEERNYRAIIVSKERVGVVRWRSKERLLLIKEKL